VTPRVDLVHGTGNWVFAALKSGLARVRGITTIYQEAVYI